MFSFNTLILQQTLSSSDANITDEELPTPPEEPSPDDCCGSGCATCVWDVYDSQMTQYKQEYEEYKKKIEEKKKGDTSSSLLGGGLLKTKRIVADSNSNDNKSSEETEEALTPEEEELLRIEQEKLSGRDDDDDDDDGDVDEDNDGSSAAAADKIPPLLDPRLSSPKFASRLRTAQSFIDPNHKTTTSSSSSSSSTPTAAAAHHSKYEGSVVVQLSTPPETIALQNRVEDEHFLTFRRDGKEFLKAELLQDDNSTSGDDHHQQERNLFSRTTLKVDFINNKGLSSSDSDHYQPHVFLPGDTVEILRTCPIEAVESFLNYLAFEGLDPELLKEHPDYLAEKKRIFGSTTTSSSLSKSNNEKYNQQHHHKLSELVMCDLSDFPFVDSPLPPWLMKCSSMKRTHDRVLYSTAQQTLPLGHICTTVVDVFSWAAVQRPLLNKLYDVLLHSNNDSSSTTTTATTDESSLDQQENCYYKQQVAALEAIIQKLSLSQVHAWMRLVWFCCCCSSLTLSSSANHQEEFIDTNNNNNHKPSSVTVRTTLLGLGNREENWKDPVLPFDNIIINGDEKNTILPPGLLDFPISNSLLKRVRNGDNNNNNNTPIMIGTVEFLLRAFPAISTELFANTVPRPSKNITKNRFSATQRPKKIFSFARALEVLPPLKGRQFSIAGIEDIGDGEKTKTSPPLSNNIITVFSNFKKIAANNNASKRDGNNNNSLSLPTWSGMVSSLLAEKDASFVENNKRNLITSSSSSSSDTDYKLYAKFPSRHQQQQRSSSSSFGQGLQDLLDLYHHQNISSSSSSSSSFSSPQQRRNVLLLSAGTGIAPFHFFFSELVKKKMMMKKSISSFSSPCAPLLRMSLIGGLSVAPSGFLLRSVSNKWVHLNDTNNNSNIDCSFHFAVSSSGTTNLTNPPNSNSHSNNRIQHHFNSRVPDIIPQVLSSSLLSLNNFDFKGDNGDNEDKLQIFSCGPPSFYSNCRNAVEKYFARDVDVNVVDNRPAAKNITLLDLKDVKWFNDDWSSNSSSSSSSSAK